MTGLAGPRGRVLVLEEIAACTPGSASRGSDHQCVQWGRWLPVSSQWVSRFHIALRDVPVDRQ